MPSEVVHSRIGFTVSCSGIVSSRKCGRHYWPTYLPSDRYRTRLSVRRTGAESRSVWSAASSAAFGASPRTKAAEDAALQTLRAFVGVTAPLYARIAHDLLDSSTTAP